MGRAIDMEKDIHTLKEKMATLENTIRGMALKLDEIDDAVFEDEEIVEEIVEEVVEEKKEKKDGKKANNKGSGSNSKRSNAKNGDSKGKNDGAGNSSK